MQQQEVQRVWVGSAGGGATRGADDHCRDRAVLQPSPPGSGGAHGVCLLTEDGRDLL